MVIGEAGVTWCSAMCWLHYFPTVALLFFKEIKSTRSRTMDCCCKMKVSFLLAAESRLRVAGIPFCLLRDQSKEGWVTRWWRRICCQREKQKCLFCNPRLRGDSEQKVCIRFLLWGVCTVTHSELRLNCDSLFFPHCEVQSVGFLVEQRAKYWGEHQEWPPWFGRRLEICFNKDCSIIPPSFASTDSFINMLHADTFGEHSPGTTVVTSHLSLIGHLTFEGMAYCTRQAVTLQRLIWFRPQPRCSGV